MTNRIGGAALAQTIVNGVVGTGTDWPNWAVYKVSADTSEGDVHRFFEDKGEAYEYALRMWEDEDVASVWYQKWEWGPQYICLAEMKPDDKEGVRYLVGELEAGRQYAIPYPLMGVGPEFLRVDRGGTIHLMVHAEVDWTQPVYHIPVPLLTKTARLRVAQAQRFGLYSRPKGDYLQAGVWPVKRWQEHEDVPYVARRRQTRLPRPQPWEVGGRVLSNGYYDTVRYKEYVGLDSTHRGFVPRS